jgi:hypothetical protein
MNQIYKMSRTLIAFFDFTFYNFVLDIYKKVVIVMCIESAVAVKLAPARRVEEIKLQEVLRPRVLKCQGFFYRNQIAPIFSKKRTPPDSSSIADFL